MKQVNKKDFEKFTENVFVSKTVGYLKRKGYSVIIEVPNMGQSVDIVAQKNRWLTFVEVKLFNWNRAIVQCKNHEIVADYIYVAISTKRISNKFLEISKQKGYGILHYNIDKKKFSIILKAKFNKTVWKPQRRILFDKYKIIKENGHTTLDVIRNFC